MKLTNKYGLPEAIIRATKKRNEAYSSRADRSVTQLISPPRIDILRKRHFREIEKDVSEEWFALLGSAVHQILEWGADDGDIVEERMFARVMGWTISGAIDVQREGDAYKIIDYKVCSTYTYTKDNGEAKKEWVEQQNLYALLVRVNKGIRVTNLSVCAIYRDWKAGEADRNPNYPQSPIKEIPIPVWTDEEQMEFLQSRVALHQKAEFLHDMDEELPECTEEDTWSRATAWSVKRTGAVRATKNFDNEDEAKEFLEQKGEGYFIEKKMGIPARCEGNYCQVATWCSQYARMQDAKDKGKQPDGTGEADPNEKGKDGQEAQPKDRLASGSPDQGEAQGGRDDEEPSP